MIAEFVLPSTSSAERINSSQSNEHECVTNSGTLVEESISETSNGEKHCKQIIQDTSSGNKSNYQSQEFQSADKSNAETNPERNCSQLESVTISTVLQDVDNQAIIDDCSSSSKKHHEDDNLSEIEHTIISPDGCGGYSENVTVKNSFDVQFGNKIYHQYDGPVIVQQVVLEDEDDRNLGIDSGGQDNIGYEPEIVSHTNEGNIQRNKNHGVLNVIIEDKNIKKGVSEGTPWLNSIRSNRKTLIIFLSILVTIVVILLIVIFMNKNNSNTSPSWREETNLSGKLKIIHRNEWLAESPIYKLDPLTLPVPNVIIAHTVTENCKNRGECTDITRYIQHYHAKDRGWSDIGYSFLVGGDGFVYEGRGWDIVGTHTIRWNNKSIGIGFIGNFEDILPPDQQIIAAQLLIEKGVKDNYLAKDYKLYGHLQLVNFRSPGEVFYENIKTWPHWTNETYINI